MRSYIVTAFLRSLPEKPPHPPALHRTRGLEQPKFAAARSRFTGISSNPYDHSPCRPASLSHSCKALSAMLARPQQSPPPGRQLLDFTRRRRRESANQPLRITTVCGGLQPRAGPARRGSDFFRKMRSRWRKSSFPHRKRVIKAQFGCSGGCWNRVSNARNRGTKARRRWPQPAAVARCLGSQWAAGGWIPPQQQRSAGPGRCSSLHTAAQLSSQLFAPGSSSRTWSVGMAATMSAMALRNALCRNGAREAHHPPRDDPVIVRLVVLCVSLGSVCENGVMVYVDYIFDYSGPFVRIDKPNSHLDVYGRRHLSPPDPFAICWLALTGAGAYEGGSRLGGGHGKGHEECERCGVDARN